MKLIIVSPEIYFLSNILSTHTVFAGINLESIEIEENFSSHRMLKLWKLKIVLFNSAMYVRENNSLE